MKTRTRQVYNLFQETPFEFQDSLIIKQTGPKKFKLEPKNELAGLNNYGLESKQHQN